MPQDEAAEAYRKGLGAHFAGDFEAAAEFLSRAAEAEPFRAPFNLAITLEALERHAEAEAALRAALRARPTEARAAFGLGNLLLAQGRFAEGWPLYEARRHIEGLTPKVDLGCPEWRGEPLAGRTLAVVGEQGFGDQIMFARFIPQIAAAGARVQFVCSPELVGVVPAGNASIRAARALSPDAWTYVATLPLRLEASLDSLPPPVALPMTPRAQTAGDGGRIGVFWKGRPNPDPGRSLTPDAAARLLALPGAVSLQPEDSGATSFLQTAEQIAGLDLVISIDSAVAHLAASMGKPTRVLLPAIRPDWRWMGGRQPTPWYPEAKLFRQPAPRDWDGAVDAVLADLA